MENECEGRRLERERMALLEGLMGISLVAMMCETRPAPFRCVLEVCVPIEAEQIMTPPARDEIVCQERDRPRVVFPPTFMLAGPDPSQSVPFHSAFSAGVPTLHLTKPLFVGMLLSIRRVWAV